MAIKKVRAPAAVENYDLSYDFVDMVASVSVWSIQSDSDLTVQDVADAFEAGAKLGAKQDLVRYEDDENVMFLTTKSWDKCLKDIKESIREAKSDGF